MSGIDRPYCAECSRSCKVHPEHRLSRIYMRDAGFIPIGWECRECKRFWRDPVK